MDFEKLREICKFYHPAFDIDHNYIDTCRMPEMIPKGASWGDCNECECPLVAKEDEESKNIVCENVIITRVPEPAGWAEDTPEGVLFPMYRCTRCQGMKEQPTKYCPYCGSQMWADDTDMKLEKMTNREWLASLSDEDLAAWLCDNYYVEEPHLLYPDITVRYTTGLTTVKDEYGYSENGLTDWFKEEHK